MSLVSVMLHFAKSIHWMKGWWQWYVQSTKSLLTGHYRLQTFVHCTMLVFKSPVLGPQKDQQLNRTATDFDWTAVASPGWSMIGPVAVVFTQPKSKDQSPTGCNRLLPGPVAYQSQPFTWARGIQNTYLLVVYYSKITNEQTHQERKCAKLHY